jgi:hypothetical protein
MVALGGLRSKLTLFAVLVVLLTMVLSLTSAAGAFAVVVAPGGIAGTVHDSTGVVPLSGMKVEIYSGNYDWTYPPPIVATAYTDLTGHYGVSGLNGFGNYWLRVSDPAWNWAPRIWTSAYYYRGYGTTITVSPAATVTVNPNMDAACVVSGHAYRKGHPDQPVSDIIGQVVWMSEYVQNSSPGHSISTSDGAYLCRGLAPGPYLLWSWDTRATKLYGPPDVNGKRWSMSAGTTTTIDLAVPLIPVTTSNCTPGWHKAPFELQLTVADGDLPPFTRHIYLGPGSYNADASSLSFNSDTSQTVWFWSKDASGNVEASKSVNVQVDATPPHTDCTATSGTVVPTLVLSATDALSGMDTTFYRIDAGAARTYAGPAAMPAGPHTVTYWSTDAVGNIEATHSIAIANPLAVVLGKPNTPSKLTHTRSFVVWGTIAPKQKKGDRTTKLYVYRRIGSSWVPYKTVWTTSKLVRGKSRYWATIKLSKTASYKLVAYSSGKYAGRWPGFSAAKFVTVK